MPFYHYQKYILFLSANRNWYVINMSNIFWLIEIKKGTDRKFLINIRECYIRTETNGFCCWKACSKNINQLINIFQARIRKHITISLLPYQHVLLLFWYVKKNILMALCFMMGLNQYQFKTIVLIYVLKWNNYIQKTIDILFKYQLENDYLYEINLVS